ncbi:hypothetical protein ACFQJD_12015 [Haloplanus sp. GCM10025708]|uniref:hypothetical protein n=1 Tax=Haloferacaceae TaxID=1644056 RepID=UPI00360ED8E5
MFGLSGKGTTGAILMVIGAAAFLPTIGPAAGTTSYVLAVAATALLTLGTYFIGTDVGGRPA